MRMLMTSSHVMHKGTERNAEKQKFVQVHSFVAQRAPRAQCMPGVQGVCEKLMGRGWQCDAEVREGVSYNIEGGAHHLMGQCINVAEARKQMQKEKIEDSQHNFAFRRKENLA